MSAPRPTLVVAGILARRRALHDGPLEFLLARRVEPPLMDGLWEFPGGKVDSGEHPLDALCRELREELSLRIVNPERFQLSRHVQSTLYKFDRPRHAVVLGYWALSSTFDEPIIDPSIHSEARWVTMRELQGLAWLPGSLEFARATAEAIRRDSR